MLSWNVAEASVTFKQSAGSWNGSELRLSTPTEHICSGDMRSVNIRLNFWIKGRRIQQLIFCSSSCSWRQQLSSTETFCVLSEESASVSCFYFMNVGRESEIHKEQETRFSSSSDRQLGLNVQTKQTSPYWPDHRSITFCRYQSTVLGCPAVGGDLALVLWQRSRWRKHSSASLMFKNYNTGSRNTRTVSSCNIRPVWTRLHWTKTFLFTSNHR